MQKTLLQCGNHLKPKRSSLSCRNLQLLISSFKGAQEQKVRVLKCLKQRSSCPTWNLNHSRTEHRKRGGDTHVVQMGKLKIRVSSSSSQTCVFHLKSLVVLAPSASQCPVGNLIH